MFVPEKSALVVIDLQKGIAALDTKPYASADVIANASKLVRAFRKKGLPVFLVHVAFLGPDALRPDCDAPSPGTVPPPDWAEFVDELDAQPSDIVITKRQWGAFHGTELDLQLRRRGVTHVVLCGIATSIGVESTARYAYELGYSQVFPEDAMASRSEEEHRSTVRNIFPRMGRVLSTEAVLELLEA